MSTAREQIDRMTALYAPNRLRGEDARVDHLRVPPHSVDAEQAVVGGLLLSPDAWHRVADVLTADDFYRRDHARIFRAIADAAERGKSFDAVTLADALAGDEGLPGYVYELASNTASAANIGAYAEIVADKARLRKLIEVGTDIVNGGFQPEGRESAELLAEAAQRIGELQPTQGGGLRKAAETLRGWYERFTERYAAGQRMTGLPTPWSEFNRVTHGLQPSTLYLLAARPSMGKSIAGLQLAMFTALRGKTVGLFSLEMSTDDCHNRMIAALSDVPHDFLIAPSADEDDDYTARMTPVIRDLQAAPLFIDDTADLTVRQFEARARRMHLRNPLDLIVVDHIHDFRIDPKLARFEYGQVAQVCKRLAKEWRIPVVALAQLNRRVSTATEKRPTLADLRESGEIEQKGDVIVFLHREDYYDTPTHKTHLQGVVEMHFAKGRNIRAGERINLRNRFDVMRMDDWEGEFPSEPKAESRSAWRGYGSGNYRSRAARGDE